MDTKRKKNKIISTTVLCVKHKDSVVIGADGQVSLGNTALKHTAKKIRRLYNNKVLAGFAGSTSDAFSLFQRFEGKLEEYNGNISRAAIEMSRDWRTDKILRRLEAMLIVANEERLFILFCFCCNINISSSDFGAKNIFLFVQANFL